MFIIPGHGNVVGLGQALSQEAKHLEVWHGQNEQGMAQAAVAFAKQMKRKQICVATSSVGPGAGLATVLTILSGGGLQPVSYTPLHNSFRLFSTGVPDRAARLSPCRERMARERAEPAFLMAWASSRICLLYTSSRP